MSDSDKAAQQARSKKYGIGIKEGGSVSQPSGDAGIPESAYGDPVNFRYPMKDKNHADNAASRWGDASNRAQYSSAEQKIIGDRIAARQKSFGETPAKEKRMDEPVIIRADGNHDAFSGSHEHSHSAFGSQGGDNSHSHSHSHDNDSNHDHSHAVEASDVPDILRSLPSDLSLYAPIVRIDKSKRHVIVRATSETLDSYGTIFDFQASKDAFTRWNGNIREMHDSKKAVGAALKWEPNEEEKAIDITLHVSRGAEDTWQKLIEDPPTLIGASVGARNGVWEKRKIDDKEVPVLTRYDLVEVSLVDSPSNPDCRIQIVRADGSPTEVLDDTEPEDTRAGKSISTANAQQMHQSAMHSLQAAKASADLCGCPACQEISLALDPDQDGDIDIGEPSLDTDHDDGSVNKQMLADGTSAMIMKSMQAEILRTVAEAIGSELKAATTQLRSVSAHLAQIHEPADQTDITRRLDDVAAMRTEMTTVRSLLSEVKALSESYAGRASTGGPVVNTGFARQQAQPQPVQPQQLAAQFGAFTELLIKQGIISDRDKQIQANVLIERLANGGK